MSNVFGVGQNVVVLGGRSDIAAAIVEQMRGIDPGVKVVACVRRPGVGEVPYDAMQSGSAEAALRAGREQLGSIDCVIVAFGVLDTEGESLTEPGRVGRNIAVNMAAACEAGVAAAQILGSSGGGDLVYLSSIAAVRARGSMAAYSSAKSGADAFYQTAARQWGNLGVRTFIVRPGFVMTKMTEHLPKKAGAAAPEAVGSAVVKAMRGTSQGVHIVYTSTILKVIAWCMTKVPKILWTRL